MVGVDGEWFIRDWLLAHSLLTAHCALLARSLDTRRFVHWNFTTASVRAGNLMNPPEKKGSQQDWFWTWVVNSTT